MLCITCKQTCSTTHRSAVTQPSLIGPGKPIRSAHFHKLSQRQRPSVFKAAAEKKETTVFGDLVDEEAQLQDIPEPGQQDFWEGEKWEWLGKLSFVLVPALVLLAVLVGAFAAKTYDSGANTFLAPPSPEDATVKLIPGKPELPFQ